MKTVWELFQRYWTGSRNIQLPPSLIGGGTENSPQYLAFLRSITKELPRQRSLHIPLKDLEVVVVDLETSGFRPYQGDEIISIGAVAMQGATILEHEKFYTLVQPTRLVSETIESLTGITNQELQNAPDLRSVLEQFFHFVGKRPLVAHHSKHEREFFRAALWKSRRVKFTHTVLDTMMLIQLSAGPLGNATLDTLCALNQIEIRFRHHAFFDALATAELWSIYLHKAARLGFDDLNQVFAQQL